MVTTLYSQSAACSKLCSASSSTGFYEHLKLAIKQAEAAFLGLMYLGNQLWFAIVLSDLP